MSAVKGRSSTPKRAMTPERLIEAAVAIVDADGFDALTIRRLADACGLSPMAVYRHVRDKDELLERVVDRVTADWADLLPPVAADWRDDVRGLFGRARELLLGHPGVAQLCVARPTPVAGVARIFDRVIGALERAGLQGQEAVLAFDALLMFLFGSVLWEIPRREDVRSRLIDVSEDAPHILELRAELARRDPAAYFEFGLDTLIAGLAPGG